VPALNLLLRRPPNSIAPIHPFLRTAPFRVKLLLAPDKFKGSLSAAAVAEALRSGWHSILPGTEFSFAPIADGGEGFCEALAKTLDGQWITLESVDAIGRPVQCRYVWIAATRTAVLEMSEASGLWRLRDDERAPLRANTFGTGLLLRDAANRGAKRILLGLGGSATTDGGIGMAAALGFRFLSSSGESLAPIPANLPFIRRIDPAQAVPLPPVTAACDVVNPLLGPRGTAAVFAPQKGASPEDVAFLENALAGLAALSSQLGCKGELHKTPGAGAAGGIGFGLLAFCGATMEPGFDLVAGASGLSTKISAADLVLTGEGRLDSQTLEGKGPAGVAALARSLGKPVFAFAGSIEEHPSVLERFDAAIPIVDRPVSLEEAMRDAPSFLERAAARTARLVSRPFKF